MWSGWRKHAALDEHREMTVSAQAKAKNIHHGAAGPGQAQGFQGDVHARIVCQDSLKFMRGLLDESMSLIVTSPPCNLGGDRGKRASRDKYVKDQAACVGEAARLLAPAGSICWLVGNHVDNGEALPLDILLYPIFTQHGLKLRNRIVWTLGHGPRCERRFSDRHGTILWFTKSDNYTFNLDPVRVPSKYPGKRHFKGPSKGLLSGNPLGKNPSDVWEVPGAKFSHVEEGIDPRKFPVGLVERLVLALTNEGEIVLDPYIGIGSSAIAALRNGRMIYGCDSSGLHVGITWERIRQLHASKLRAMPMDGPGYQPMEKQVT